MLRLLRSPLARRLTLLFLLASVLPLGGAGWLILQGLERVSLEDATRRQSLVAEGAAGLVRQWVARSSDKLETMARLASSHSFGEATAMEQIEVLVEATKLFLEVQQIAGTETQPELIAQTMQTDYAQAQRAIPNVRALLESRFHANAQQAIVRDPLSQRSQFRSKIIERSFGFRALPISVPYGDATTKEGGALVGYLDMRRLDEALAGLVQGDMRIEVRSAKSLGKATDDASVEIAASGSEIADEIRTETAVGYGDWTVRVTEPRARIDEGYLRARHLVVIGIGIAIALASLASFVFASRVLRPVNILTATATRLEHGNLSARSGIDRRDEIGQLGRSFDAMATALEKLDDAKSDFIRTVSHELRTPLTSLRLSVANLADGVVGPLEARQQVVVERIARDVDRLVARVGDLLALAKIEAGVEQARIADIDLSELARGILDALRPLAETRCVRLETCGIGSGRADRGMLERMIINLVDNAIKFGPEKGAVTVAIEGATLTVLDDGGGFEDESLFEAFVQAESDGVKNPGVGLGLSIVRKLATLQNAKLERVRTPRHGFRITVGEAKR
ncbi:MAG: HAMP domain-containing histidine kinase [Planctomycetes bacterium]|nr:HAMP domain-containing histidine kinase [Planctomycetota bacterium]